MLSFSSPWKMSLALILKPDNNLRHVLMTTEKTMPQILRSTALKKSNHCANQDQNIQTKQSPRSPSQKAVWLWLQSHRVPKVIITLLPCIELRLDWKYWQLVLLSCKKQHCWKSNVNVLPLLARAPFSLPSCLPSSVNLRRKVIMRLWGRTEKVTLSWVKPRGSPCSGTLVNFYWLFDRV